MARLVAALTVLLTVIIGTPALGQSDGRATVTIAWASEDTHAGRFGQIPEGGSDELVIRRDATDGALDVEFELRGEAVDGGDVVTSGGTVHFGPGQEEARVPVAAAQDTDAEHPEHVLAVLVPSDAFLLAERDFAATAYVVDDEEPVVEVAATDPDGFEHDDHRSRDVMWVLLRRGDPTVGLDVRADLTPLSSDPPWFERDAKGEPSGTISLRNEVVELPLQVDPEHVVCYSVGSHTGNPCDNDHQHRDGASPHPNRALELVVRESDGYRVGERDRASTRIANDDPTVERIAGKTRVETAAATAEWWWNACLGHAESTPWDGPCRPESVVLARADDPADALSAAALASALEAPVLLTPPDHLHEAAAEVLRSRPRTVYLVGGTAALSEAVARAAHEHADFVDRIAGTDRFATAAEVVRTLDPDEVYVVEGADSNPTRGWPDAVSVSWTGRPLLMTTTAKLPEATRAVLEERDIGAATIVGGTTAVSVAVEEELSGLVDDVSRIAGADRYATSAAVVRDQYRQPARVPFPGQELWSTNIWLATGRNWPDALAGGPTVALDRGALVLVDGSDPAGSQSTRDWLRNLDLSYGRVRVLGGQAAVTDAVVSAIRNDVGTPGVPEPSPELAREPFGGLTLDTHVDRDRYGPGDPVRIFVRRCTGDAPFTRLHDDFRSSLSVRVVNDGGRSVASIQHLRPWSTGEWDVLPPRQCLLFAWLWTPTDQPVGRYRVEARWAWDSPIVHVPYEERPSATSASFELTNGSER